MSNNYKTLIENVVAMRAKELGTEKLDVAFMSIANEYLMLDYDLSIDELESGDTDGGLDGQIDAMFVIVNGALYAGDLGEDIPPKGPLDVQIVIIQSKNSDSFQANPLTIIRSTVNDLFDLSKTYGEYLPNYDEKLQNTFALARQAILATAGRAATVSVRVFYASKGATDNIHQNVIDTSQALQADLVGKTATPDVAINFVGARELVDLVRQPKTRQRQLLHHSALSSDAGDSYLCLVPIDALVSFLSAESGSLIRSMFDANVRDFLGKTEVNEAIRVSLNELEEGDFWWLNNGITIVASAIDPKGKTLALTEPLLVNGLQTSSVIHAFMTDPTVSADLKVKRGKQIVLVKIILPPNEEVRDKVIKATNSQTNIPKPYLRGMDTVHRNIEDALKPDDLFYERRKNQYRNLGKPLNSIVTLSEMAQSLMAAILFRPADARGRPNSLLKSDDDYQMLFSESYDLVMFKNVILAKRLIMGRLPVLFPNEQRTFRNDVVFHVLAYMSAAKFKAPGQAAHGWRTNIVTEAEVDAAITVVAAMFKAAGGTDRVAKNTGFQDLVLLKARSESVVAVEAAAQG